MYIEDDRRRDIVNRLIEVIEDKALSLTDALEEVDGATRSMFYKMLREEERLFKENEIEEPILRNKYARACEARADFLFDEALRIADGEDNLTEVVKEDDNGNEYSEFVKIDSKEAIMRDRLRWDARRFHIMKMNPKKYGDKIDVTSDGNEIKQVTIFQLPDNNREIE